jgi:O-antigen ligase
MSSTIASSQNLSLRLLAVFFVASAVSLPIGGASLAKVLLFVVGLLYLTAGFLKNTGINYFGRLWTPASLLLAVATIAASLMWTEVGLELALHSLVKHAKVIQIVLLVYLIRSLREARMAVTIFIAFQIFVLLSSWALAFGVSLPWAAGSNAIEKTRFVVFTDSYLDQSIMFVSTAAICWHLASEKLLPRNFATFVAVAALLNVLLLLPGRTGYVIAAVVLCLSASWAIGVRPRLIVFVGTALILAACVYMTSDRVKARVDLTIKEVHGYSGKAEVTNSAGWRMHVWLRSMQAIQERPWLGYGVGSWTPAVRRLEGSSAEKTFGVGPSSNPHQEYLLWGVELGALGFLLLSTFLLAVVRDALQFTEKVKHATISLVTVIATVSLFNSSLYDDHIGDYLCVALGLLLAYGQHSQGNDRQLCNLTNLSGCDCDNSRKS